MDTIANTYQAQTNSGQSSLDQLPLQASKITITPEGKATCKEPIALEESFETLNTVNAGGSSHNTLNEDQIEEIKNHLEDLFPLFKYHLANN